MTLKEQGLRGTETQLEAQRRCAFEGQRSGQDLEVEGLFAACILLGGPIQWALLQGARGVLGSRAGVGGRRPCPLPSPPVARQWARLCTSPPAMGRRAASAWFQKGTLAQRGRVQVTCHQGQH